jgi:hypothetical protein
MRIMNDQQLATYRWDMALVSMKLTDFRGARLHAGAFQRSSFFNAMAVISS